ncbi:MAG: hypothetical protein PHY93_10820 [Bacteriovorax sp.]|nr:hypothetical protein [Bacteriovorax sp.]
MKTLLLTTLIVSNIMMSAPGFAARGNSSGGGGDASEERVNDIRSDILNWINTGGAKGLVLPDNLSYAQYVTQMTEVLTPQKIIIGFTNKQVKVNDAEKTCKGFITKADSKTHILCNISRFKNTPEADQYSLIHHEYAGLADVENNQGASSDYSISNQISGYLANQVVKRLSVKKNLDSGRVSEREFKIISTTVTKSGYGIAWGLEGQSLDFDHFDHLSYDEVDKFLDKNRKKIKNYIVDIENNKVVYTFKDANFKQNKIPYSMDDIESNHLDRPFYIKLGGELGKELQKDLKDSVGGIESMNLIDLSIDGLPYQALSLGVVKDYYSRSEFSDVIISNDDQQLKRIDGADISKEINVQAKNLVKNDHYRDCINNDNYFISSIEVNRLSDNDDTNLFTIDYTCALKGKLEKHVIIQASVNLSYKNEKIKANVLDITELDEYEFENE